MTTNKVIPNDSELFKKGQILIRAAYDYWKEYQKECGSAAVVWLDCDDGHFILFTRGEYKADIMRRATSDYHQEPAMFEPFTDKEPPR